MATLEVEYTVKVKQTIHWPDDELDNLNYDNLMVNLDPAIANDIGEPEEISNVKKNGEQYEL